MKKYLGIGILTAILVTIFVSQPYNLDYATLPYDWDTVSRGKPSYLASNDSSLQIPLNQLVDSTQQLRNLFAGYLTDLVLTAKQSFVVQLDEDASGTESFVVLSDGGDTLLKVSEDLSGYINVTTFSADSLSVSGTIIDKSGNLTVSGNLYADSLGVSSTTIDQNGNISVAGEISNTGDLVVATNKLFVDVSESQVGIGTEAPSGLLHVYQGSSGGTAGTDADDLILEGSGITGMSILGGSSSASNMFLGSTLGSMAGFSYNNSTDLLSIFTDGSARVYIDNTGMVGIGTNPNHILHTSNSNGSVQFEDTNGAETVIIYNSNPSMSPPETVGEIAFNAKNTIGSPETYALIACVAEDNTSSSEDGYIIFETITSGSRTEKVRISSDGDIGIGTTSPDGKLHIHTGSAGTVTSTGDLTVESDGNSVIQLLSPAINETNINFGDPDDVDDGKIRYEHTYGSMTISSGGGDEQLILGTNSGVIETPDNFEVNGTYFKMPVKTDTGDPATPANGWCYVNIFDNKISCYADGAWRDLATW